MRHLIRSAASMCLPIVLAAAPVAAQSGGSYAMASNTIGGGGQTFAAGGAYRLGGSTGQTDAGRLGGGAYVMYAGFWGPASSAVTDAPHAAEAPTGFAVRSPAPNPFRAATTIGFDLPAPAQVQISVHAVNGRLVRRLLAEARGPGRHAIAWDGRDQNGRSLGAGVYFAHLRAGEFATTLRLVRMH